MISIQTILLTFTFASFILATGITQAPKLQPHQVDSNSASCDSFTSFEADCVSSTPGFLNLGVGKQISCLCYRSSTWAPSTYEGYYRGCLSYYKTASPALYKSIDGDAIPTDYCNSVSQLLQSSSLTSGSPNTSIETPIAIPSDYPSSCKSWLSLVSSCEAATPVLTQLAFSSQASCLCGISSSTYLYDQYWQSCISYRKTAEPTQWSSLGGDSILKTPCAAAAAGNFGIAPTGTTVSTSSQSSSPSSNAAWSNKKDRMELRFFGTGHKILQALPLAFHLL